MSSFACQNESARNRLSDRLFSATVSASSVLRVAGGGSSHQQQSQSKSRGYRRALTALMLICLLTGGQRVVSSTYLLGKAEVAKILIAHAWEKTLLSGRNVKPWPWADTHPIARLRVPRLATDMILLENASDRNLAFGGAHVAGTGLPGENLTSAFAGHRDSHFAFLEQLRTGDLIEVETPQRHRYLVSDIRIINSRHQGIPLTDRNQLLLTTCYPFDHWQAGGPLRYLVTAEPLEDKTHDGIKE